MPLWNLLRPVGDMYCFSNTYSMLVFSPYTSSCDRVTLKSIIISIHCNIIYFLNISQNKMLQVTWEIVFTCHWNSVYAFLHYITFIINLILYLLVELLSIVRYQTPQIKSKSLLKNYENIYFRLPFICQFIIEKITLDTVFDYEISLYDEFNKQNFTSGIAAAKSNATKNLQNQCNFLQIHLHAFCTFAKT